MDNISWCNILFLTVGFTIYITGLVIDKIKKDE